MVTMNSLLCSILAISLVVGTTNADITLSIENVSQMSDRDIIEALVKSVAGHEKRIKTLEATVVRQNDVIAVLQKILEDTGTDGDIVSGPDVAEEAKNNAMEYQKSQKKSRQENVAGQRIRQAGRTGRQVSASLVAFSALADHMMSHLGAGQNLIFEKTNVNTNNVYNPHTGVFTAPVPGIYLITTSILAYYNQENRCNIVVNGVVVGRIYNRGTDNRHDQGSQTILLHLKHGDNVAITNDDVDDSIYGNSYTTFSGFLLYEQEHISIVG